MYRWFVPCFSGDFRLEAISDDASRCLLTVEDPTPLDRERLAPFLAEAKERGWLDARAEVTPVGKTILPITAPMLEAGPILAMSALPDDVEKWTAIRRGDDSVTLEDGVGARLREQLATGRIEVKGDRGELVAAVTFREPKRGCPAPEPAPRRASQVLAAFSTVRQIESFQDRRFLVAYGNQTGKPYNIYHRTEAARRGLPHCIVQDVEDGEDLICAWDDRVPAEEEVLGLKLAVEHREDWLLN